MEEYLVVSEDNRIVRGLSYRGRTIKCSVEDSFDILNHLEYALVFLDMRKGSEIGPNSAQVYVGNMKDPSKLVAIYSDSLRGSDEETLIRKAGIELFVELPVTEKKVEGLLRERGALIERRADVWSKIN